MPNDIIKAEKFQCYWCLFKNFERFLAFKMHSCLCRHVDDTNQLEYFYSKPHVFLSMSLIVLNLISSVFYLKKNLFEEYNDLHIVYTTAAICGATAAFLILLQPKEKLITIAFTTDILQWKETLLNTEDKKSVKKKITFLGYFMVAYTSFLFVVYVLIYCKFYPVDFFGNFTIIISLYILQCVVFHCESAWLLADISYKTFRNKLIDVLQKNLFLYPTNKNIISTVRNFSVWYFGKDKLVQAYWNLYILVVMFAVAFLPFVITFAVTYFLKVFFRSVGVNIFIYNGFFLLEFLTLLLMFCNVLRDFYLLLKPVSSLKKNNSLSILQIT